MIVNPPYKLYEDEGDRSNQQNAIELLMDKWNFVAEDCGPQYPLDYICKRDNRYVAFVEVRVRSCSINTYKSVICSLNKYSFGYDKGKLFNIPVLFLVKWLECGSIGYIDMMTVKTDLGMQHKDYRNDKRDVGPIVHFPINQFKLF